jgi:DNA-binding NarL/FixJ family response regulator
MKEAGEERSLRVLVVEDEFIIALALRTQLEALGCEVVGTAREGESAVAMAQELRPDIVFMDIGLAGGNGVEATREIMAEAPTCVVLVTAYQDHRVEQALEAGACLALTKPVLTHQLADVVAQVRSGLPEGRSGRCMPNRG